MSCRCNRPQVRVKIKKIQTSREFFHFCTQLIAAFVKYCSFSCFLLARSLIIVTASKFYFESYDKSIQRYFRKWIYEFLLNSIMAFSLKFVKFKKIKLWMFFTVEYYFSSQHLAIQCPFSVSDLYESYSMN